MNQMVVLKLILLLLIIVLFYIIECKISNGDDFIAKVKECYEKSAIKRNSDNNRNVNTIYNYNKYDPLVRLESVIDDIDISQMETLSICIKEIDPTRFEDRKFDQNAQKYGGGNDVIYLTGLLPIIIPTLSQHLIEVASTAAEEIGWRPHVKHLGFRCIEKLMYHPGGELLYHVDSGSIYTLVLMFSNENDYTGGEFQIVDNDGNPINYKASKRGGILFNSNQDHGVTPIKTGERHVLAVEFWPYEDTNIEDRRPREIDYKYKYKLPKLLEVSTNQQCQK